MNFLFIHTNPTSPPALSTCKTQAVRESMNVGKSDSERIIYMYEGLHDKKHY